MSSSYARPSTRSAVGLAIVTPEGVFHQLNRAFCAMTGYAPDELLGQSFRGITHPDDIARDEEQLRLVRAGREPLGTVDKRYLRKDGSEIWVRRSIAILRDPAGQVRFVIGAFVDLTEQRGKDRALQQAERLPHRDRRDRPGGHLHHGRGRASSTSGIPRRSASSASPASRPWAGPRRSFPRDAATRRKRCCAARCRARCST